MPNLKNILTIAACATALGTATMAEAAEPQGPGIDALAQLRKGRPAPSAVQNRFFLKSNRFELAPMLGFVPNNPFAQRFVGGVGAGYHFTETLSVQGLFAYSPDLGTNDLKGLTKTLINIAASSGDRDFRQPLDKVTLQFAASAVWAPLYGKINLIGETVINFDLYFVAGITMNSKTNYYACESPLEAGEVSLDPTDCDAAVEDVVRVGPNAGLGFNFFLSQSVAFKLDGRMNFYVDRAPSYDPTQESDERRLYNNFVVSGGVSVFFPKMKERIYDF